MDGHREQSIDRDTEAQCDERNQSVDTISLRGSRRDILKGLATVGIGASLGAGSVLAGSDMALAQTPSSDDRIPHQYYPRPDMDRRPFTGGEWMNLNGTWDFRFDPDDIGEKNSWYQPDATGWDRQIRVPFPYQSLAAFGNQDEATYSNYSGEHGDYVGSAWYRRDITVPNSFPSGKRVTLRFGAVDWSAKVWLDGELVGEHEGGHTPFEVDLGQRDPTTDHTLVVKTWDPGEDDEYPAGKQIGWYEEVGGIWQSVWIEPRDDVRLSTVHVTPNLEFDGSSRTPSKSMATVEIETEEAVSGTAAITITEVGVVEQLQPKPLERGDTIAETTIDIVNGTGSTDVSVPDPALWEPDEPNVYTASVRLSADGREQDGVLTTFGMRKIDTDWAPGSSPEATDDVQDQYQYIYLNNHPIYLRAVLDQAFGPWGVWTYTGAFRGPSFEGSLKEPEKGSILYDVKKAKEIGLNCLRIHIKVNNPLYYHFSDLLGLFVWQDTPNKNAGTDAANDRFEMVFRNEIEHNYNHPSIVIRSPFNEEWGLTGGTEQLARYARLTKELDPTRLVCDNSGWEHTPETDLNDYHDYTGGFTGLQSRIQDISEDTHPGSSWNFRTGEQSGEPMLNGEVAAMAANSSTWHDVSWSYKWITDLMRADPKHGGFLYTELMDQEWELNGLMMYDRTNRFPGYLDTERTPQGTAYLNTDDLAVIDLPPVETVEPGEIVEAPIFFSHFGDRDLSDTTLHWRFSGTDRTGEWIDTGIAGSTDVSIAPYTVTQLHTVTFEAPDEVQGGYFWTWIEADDERVGENFVNLEVYGDSAPQVESTENGHTIRFDPTSPTNASWNLGTETFRNDGARAIMGFGRGSYEYEVDIPSHVSVSEIKEASLVFEASAGYRQNERTSNGALRINQTDERLTPSTVDVSVNGSKQATITLPDDRADSRGYLSYANDTKPGGLGYRVVVPIEDIAAIRDQRATDSTATVTFASTGGGIRLYGERTGRYGISPQLNLYTETGQVSKELPDSQLRSALGPTLDVGTPNTFESGESFEIVAAFVNPNDETSSAVRDIEFSLDGLPNGWTSTQKSGNDRPVITPGDAAFAIFEIGPNAAGMHIDDVSFDVQVTYRSRGTTQHTLERSATVDPTWRFHQGDDTAWKNPTFDDSEWTHVELPYDWDSHGYTEDTVFGWFRTSVSIPKELEDNDEFLGINLPVGRIDDVDATYFNGTKVGQTGLFPSDEGGPELAWSVQRNYTVPRELINFGSENVIAIRVWDQFFAGGITGGSIGPITKRFRD